VPVTAGVIADRWTGSSCRPALSRSRPRPEVGFPVLVKAAFGGGPVPRHAGFVATAGDADRGGSPRRGGRRSAPFGNGTVFLAGLVERPPGNIEVLGPSPTPMGRSCTSGSSGKVPPIQRPGTRRSWRRSPSPVVDDTLRARGWGRRRSRPRKADRLRSAARHGRVHPRRPPGEFSFFFLECQHPGCRSEPPGPPRACLPAWDLVGPAAGCGRGQGRCPTKPYGPSLSGHAIEARLYAGGRPPRGLPAGHRLAAPVRRAIACPGVRPSTPGLQTGGQVSVHYDPIAGQGDRARRDPRAGPRGCWARRAGRRRGVLGVVTNRDLPGRGSFARGRNSLDGHIDHRLSDPGHDPADA